MLLMYWSIAKLLSGELLGRTLERRACARNVTDQR
jgi:hypothetical protein